MNMRTGGFEYLDENRHDKSFNGPWTWFKLQDHATLSKTKNVYLVTYIVSENAVDNAEINHIIKYFIKAKRVNNPFAQVAWRI